MRFPSINPKLLCFIFLLGFSVEGSYSSIEPLRKLAEFNDKVQQGAESRSKNNQYGTTKNFGKIFYPIGYGADPTGKIDSSVAIMNTIIDAFKVESSFELLPGVNDLGGVAIDLQGGNYIINQPIRLPGGGNVLIQGGTIRASKVFPGDRHLIELWAPTSSTSSKIEQPETIHPQSFSDMKAAHSTGIYYEDITFRDILFDSSLRGGGLYIADAARIRIDHCFFIRFTTQGIIVQKGHETFITSSFLGQRLTIGGDKGEKHFSGTAIDLASNDNAVSDVAIFSAATGVILRGQANILTGIHCYNKATFFGGVGILVKLAGLSQTRIDNCYMDYTAIVMEDPVQVHVTNGFFLGDANIVLKSIKGEISGLNIVDNMFSGTWNTIIKMEGKFTNINQAVVDRNNVDGGMVLKSTVAKLSVPGNGTKWVANFSKVLLFPNKINHVQYSMYIRGHQPGVFPLHAVTGVSNNAVTVESDKPVNGVVTVVVDQYNLPGEKNALL